MDSHFILICLGSNNNFELTMPLVRTELKKLFPSIVYGEEMDTLPVGIESLDMFKNQMGYFYTELSIDKLKTIFKGLERKCGRTIEEKKKNIISMDIDLLVYDQTIQKKKDIDLDYIKRGIEELRLSSENFSLNN